jgi:SAM-dependent methyltransferase
MSFYLREPVILAERSRTGVDWEECACLLCGSSNWKPLVEAPDRARGGTGLWFMVVQCQECSLCFTNPRPAAPTLERFYPLDYAPHRRARIRANGPRWWQRLLANRLKLARKALPVHGQGRLLDFGCGSGSFLLRMRQQGWNVTGLDMSEAVVDCLRSQHGLHALTGSLPHPALEEGSLDVITMWQALEHVPQPLEVLRVAHQLLTPGGKLLVTVPNIDSLAFRWFGSAWNGLDLPRHLVHFRPATLRLMLQRAGFRTVRVSMIRRSGWLRASARLATRHWPPQTRWCRWLQGKIMANAASWYGYCTRQADCLMATASRK